ncbi:MAG: hypothetical protein ACKVHU_01155 [Acidimicrobiales bacterium]|jgi:hypothetical protein
MKFVFTYHGGNGMPQSEAEQAQLMEAWGAWMGAVGASAVDGGNPFAESRTVHPDGSVSNDGGAIAQGCPVLQVGATVEVSMAVDM